MCDSRRFERFLKILKEQINNTDDLVQINIYICIYILFYWSIYIYSLTIFVGNGKNIEQPRSHTKVRKFALNTEPKAHLPCYICTYMCVRFVCTSLVVHLAH